VSTRSARLVTASFLCVSLLYVSLVAVGCIGAVTRLADDQKYVVRVDDSTGWRIHELKTGVGTDRTLTVTVAPQAGGNAYSLTVNGEELLRQPPRISDLPGFVYGNPILYPTPNRVRDGKFAFGERQFQFSRNHNGNHLHGLVNTLPWVVGALEVEDEVIKLPLTLDISEGHPVYEDFPFDHKVEVTYSLSSEGLRIDAKVKNRDTRRLPFGFAIHPYFRILGERAETFIAVPARRHMEASQFSLLPTGELHQLDGSAKDLRSPVSLDKLDLDDVYWGMDPDRPAVYEARDRGVRVTLEASEIFSHMVVYTPRDQDYFCLENQTCSTDAHNLYSRGQSEAAHLLILEPVGSPGATAEGSVLFRIEFD